MYDIIKAFSYCDFVLAKQNSISTELPVVIGSQSSQNNLNSCGGLVQVGREFKSMHLVVSSDSPEDNGKRRSNFIAKEFVLRGQ